MAETMTERRERFHDEREVPEGCELVAVPDPPWRLVDGKRCRAQAGHWHTACGQPSVAELNRSAWRNEERWWAYCGNHMYDKWVEGGQVMHWILREKQDASPPGA